MSAPFADRLQIASNMEQLKAVAESAADCWRSTSRDALAEARAVGAVDLPDDPGPEFQKAVRRWLRAMQTITAKHCEKLRERERRAG